MSVIEYKKEVDTQLKLSIATYWWNGRKVKDFEGSYNRWFIDRGVRISFVRHPDQKERVGIRFRFGIGSTKFVIDAFDNDPKMSFDTAIRTFLTYLGDKALFQTGNNRQYRINY